MPFSYWEHWLVSYYTTSYLSKEYTDNGVMRSLKFWGYFQKSSYLSFYLVMYPQEELGVKPV